MGEPTVTAIPGILLRTIARTIARILFLLAGIMLIIGLGLTWLSFTLCTWRTARPKRTQATVELLTAFTGFAKTFKR